MSLSSTATIKSQLTTSLGPKAPSYFESLESFVTGKISRSEFEESLKSILDASNLKQLHNALIISIFDARSFKRPPTPPPDAPKPPPRKRRRMLPYQGESVPEGDLSLRSARLKRWTISVGKQERERLKNLQSLPPPVTPHRPSLSTDEIYQERAITLAAERGVPPGGRPAVTLASMSRAPTILQHISDRLNLICSQHNLGPPARSASSLMSIACEVKLKQLITHALTLTSESLAISSITTHAKSRHSKILTTAAFETLFTVSPTDLPNRSSSAMRLSLGEPDEEDIPHEDNLTIALLKQRSGVRDALNNTRM